MSFFEWEWRLAVDAGIKITRQLFLDKFRGHDMLWLRIWKLHPVVHEVVGDPEDGFINSLTPQLLNWIRRRLLLHIQRTLRDPVVLLRAEDLSEEFDGGCA